MEPEFRFCTSSDGTRLAYATYGSGPPLLYANNLFASMDELFTMTEARTWLDGIAGKTTVVIFDQRGSGESDREVDDLSVIAEARDMAAVADAAGLRQLTLFSYVNAGACAHFVIEHPGRVERLILEFASR
jgi:pimeloyl-ACP methyl ester carboxylesterase